MSVLKKGRTESKAVYVNTAIQIHTRTANFLSRLSARYSRILLPGTINVADMLIDNCEMANSIIPTDMLRIKLREEYLLKARAALNALDLHLAECYETMLLNPAGCFVNSNGEPVKEQDAIKRLDNLAQELGDAIDEEGRLLTSQLDYVKKKENSLKAG